MSKHRVVIVGGGAAAHSVCSTLRKGGFDGIVLVLSNETLVPYDRPPLSKDVLAGRSDEESLPFSAPDWYAANDIEVRTGTEVVDLDCDGQRVELASGEWLPYDSLVLATGGRARQLPGVDGERVHHLRTVEDARRLGQRLEPTARMAIVGGGFIGCEVAATARERGVDVTILDIEDVLLKRALGPQIGSIIQGVHESHGVKVRAGITIGAARLTDTGVAIETSDGGIETDHVLVAIGMIPNTELAQQAGIKVEDGIVVDAEGRTSAPNVWAVGDVAAQWSDQFGRHRRVEHHDNAVRQGAVVAYSLMGMSVPHTAPPWFWSDQYTHNLQGFNMGAAHDRAVVRGDPATLSFSVFHLAGDQLVAAFSFDRGKDMTAARKLLAAGIHPTADQLIDESVELRRLLPRPVKAR